MMDPIEFGVIGKFDINPCGLPEFPTNLAKNVGWPRVINDCPNKEGSGSRAMIIWHRATSIETHIRLFARRPGHIALCLGR